MGYLYYDCKRHGLFHRKNKKHDVIMIEKRPCLGRGVFCGLSSGQTAGHFLKSGKGIGEELPEGRAVIVFPLGRPVPLAAGPANGKPGTAFTVFRTGEPLCMKSFAQIAGKRLRYGHIPDIAQFPLTKKSFCGTINLYIHTDFSDDRNRKENREP